MNTPGLLKCAGAVVALVIVSACGSGSTVAPSAATLNATYVGRTLFVNGRPVTAARLNPLPRYAELVPDKSKQRTTSTSSTTTARTPAFSTIQKAPR